MTLFFYFPINDSYSAYLLTPEICILGTYMPLKPFVIKKTRVILRCMDVKAGWIIVTSSIFKT